MSGHKCDDEASGACPVCARRRDMLAKPWRYDEWNEEPEEDLQAMLFLPDLGDEDGDVESGEKSEPTCSGDATKQERTHAMKTRKTRTPPPSAAAAAAPGAKFRKTPGRKARSKSACSPAAAAPKSAPKQYGRGRSKTVCSPAQPQAELEPGEISSSPLSESEQEMKKSKPACSPALSAAPEPGEISSSPLALSIDLSSPMAATSSSPSAPRTPADYFRIPRASGIPAVSPSSSLAGLHSPSVSSSSPAAPVATARRALNPFFKKSAKGTRAQEDSYGSYGSTIPSGPDLTIVYEGKRKDGPASTSSTLTLSSQSSPGYKAAESRDDKRRERSLPAPSPSSPVPKRSRSQEPAGLACPAAAPPRRSPRPGPSRRSASPVNFGHFDLLSHYVAFSNVSNDKTCRSYLLALSAIFFQLPWTSTEDEILQFVSKTCRCDVAPDYLTLLTRGDGRARGKLTGDGIWKLKSLRDAREAAEMLDGRHSGGRLVRAWVMGSQEAARELTAERLRRTDRSDEDLGFPPNSPSIPLYVEDIPDGTRPEKLRMYLQACEVFLVEDKAVAVSLASYRKWGEKMLNLQSFFTAELCWPARGRGGEVHRGAHFHRPRTSPCGGGVDRVRRRLRQEVPARHGQQVGAVLQVLQDCNRTPSTKNKGWLE